LLESEVEVERARYGAIAIVLIGVTARTRVKSEGFHEKDARNLE
jgi:hypothetical protein